MCMKGERQVRYRDYYCSLPIRGNNVQVIDGIAQGDTANVVHVTLMEGEMPYDFSGFTDIILTILTPGISESTGDNIRLVSKYSSEESYNDENPYLIKAASPKEGRIDFTISGNATAFRGLYFAELKILGDGEVVTAAKLNYRVSETISEDIPLIDATTGDVYTNVMSMYRACSAMLTAMRNWESAERGRADNEAEREDAENERTAHVSEQLREVSNALDDLEDSLNQARVYSELCYQYSLAAEAPTQEAIERAIESRRDIASKTYVDDAIEAMSNEDVDYGQFDDDPRQVMQVAKGDEDDIPVLQSGEIALCEDTGNVFIGSPDGNLPLRGHYLAQGTAPSRTDIFWIDTAHNNVIKFYNGSTWVATATAVFS